MKTTQIPIVALMVAVAAQAIAESTAPDGVLTLKPVYERSCIAVRVPLSSTQALAGVRWFNNDDQTVFPNLLVAGGVSEVPPLYSDAVIVAEQVGGAEYGWSVIELSQPVVSATNVIYVIFQLPANQEGEEIGVGPGFGHLDAGSGSCVFLSGDGDEWVRLEADYQLMVDPVYTTRVPGMMSLACSIGGPSDMQIEIIDEGPVVERTELLRPYPNPFNPVTKISFTLKNSGHVRLAVYDVRGRWIRDLKNDELAMGIYEIPWFGNDSIDRRVASGVYFARLQADGKTESQRLLLIK